MADTMGDAVPSTESDASEQNPFEGTPLDDADGSVTPPEGSDGNDDTFTVQIDGKEVEVTLEELQSGYMRQADYTRKTQDVAANKRRLETLERFEQSLESDAALTIQQLAEAYGVELTPAQQQAAAEAAAQLDPDDPVAKELNELKQWKQQVESQFTQRQEAEMQAQIDADLDAVKTEFNDPNLDETELLEFAIENSVPNLKLAYRAMKSIKDDAASKSPQVKKPSVPVEGGGGGATVTDGGNKKMSLDEAFGSAKKTLGFG